MPPELLDEVIAESDVLWTPERELLAAAVERLDIIISIYAKVYGNRKVDPITIPRPKREIGHLGGHSDDSAGASAPKDPEGTVRFGAYLTMIQM